MGKTFFRIHTEYRENLEKLTGHFFYCFAIVKGRGCWQGATEDSACIELILDASERDMVEALARAIKDANTQEAVYITATPVELIVV